MNFLRTFLKIYELFMNLRDQNIYKNIQNQNIQNFNKSTEKRIVSN